MRNERSAPADSTALDCTVAAWSWFSTPVEQLEPHRQPGTVAGNVLSAAFLRHADEQTVAAVAALVQAIPQVRETAFRTWGVLGCNHQPGRATVACNFARYAKEGAWGVSPHIVPHRCLHSLSGTLSLALKCEGPNFGVGEPETLLPLALAWLTQGRVPGLWLALTSIDPELPPLPDTTTPTPGSVVHALVLALTPAGVAPLRLRLRPVPTALPPSAWALPRVEAWLAGREAGDWALPGGLVLERHAGAPRVPAAARLLVGNLQEVRQ